MGSGPALASAGINQQMSFSGKIVNSDGTNITNGTYNMEFKIYQDGNSSGVGSTLKWTEDWRVGQSEGGIGLTNGTFQVNLGAGSDSAALDSSVNWNQSVLWLSIQIGNTSSCTISTSFQADCGGDGEMTPYIRLTAVPQAFNAEQLGGLSYAAFSQLSANNAYTGTNNFTNTSATALTVAGSGSNYGLQVDESTASAVTGLKIKAAAAGGGLALSTINGNAAEALTIDAKGTGTLTLQSSATGDIQFFSSSYKITSGGALTVSSCTGCGGSGLSLGVIDAGPSTPGANGAILSGGVLYMQSADATHPGLINFGTQSFGGDKTFSGAVSATSTSATAFTVASSGSNYGLQIDESTASAVTGLKIKAGTAGGGLALSTINGNAAESLTIDAKGTGALTLQSSATGDIRFFGSSYKITSSGALTVVSLTAGGDTISDFTGNGLTVASGALTLNLQTGSGLEVSASGLSLDRTCGANQILKWSGSAWACADDGGAITHISGTSGAAGSDMTTQVLTADSSTCTTTALCSASMSTTGVGAGKWKFRYTIYYQSAATTTGIAFGVNHTGASSSLIQAMWYMITTGGAAATGIGDNAAATNAGQLAEGKSGNTINAVIGSASAGVATANTTSMAVLEGTMIVTNSGTLELKMASEVASSAVKLMTGTSLELYPL